MAARGVFLKPPMMANWDYERHAHLTSELMDYCFRLLHQTTWRKSIFSAISKLLLVLRMYCEKSQFVLVS